MAGPADHMRMFDSLLIGEREGNGRKEQRLERRIAEIGGHDLARRALVFVRIDQLWISRGSVGGRCVVKIPVELFAKSREQSDLLHLFGEERMDQRPYRFTGIRQH